jgi:hypothetical protein
MCSSKEKLGEGRWSRQEECLWEVGMEQMLGGERRRRIEKKLHMEEIKKQ